MVLTHEVDSRVVTQLASVAPATNCLTRLLPAKHGPGRIRRWGRKKNQHQAEGQTSCLAQQHASVQRCLYKKWPYAPTDNPKILLVDIFRYSPSRHSYSCALWTRRRRESSPDVSMIIRHLTPGAALSVHLPYSASHRVNCSNPGVSRRRPGETDESSEDGKIKGRKRRLVYRVFRVYFPAMPIGLLAT